LIDLIRDHHEPERAAPEARGLIDVVQVAESVSRAVRVKEEDADFKFQLDEGSAARVGLSVADLGGLCAALHDEFKIACALVSIR
jgi:hypothetical protein